MQKMIEFLSQYKRKKMPGWLKNLNPDDDRKPDIQYILNGRVVFTLPVILTVLWSRYLILLSVPLFISMRTMQ